MIKLPFRTIIGWVFLFGITCQMQAITRSLTYNGSTLSTTTNIQTTVSKASSALTLSSNTDYVITAAEGTEAMSATVNITNSRATVIFRNIRPSVVIGNWLRYININGAQAVNGTNCRVEPYRHGAILLPYADGVHPLTVYKGTALSGESNNLYEVGTIYTNLGSYDNAINSFTLKRGYMVTMANHKDGTGYSHCFIADKGDITVTLPKDMRNSVSFLRVFRWRWPSKKGYAGRTLTPMGLMRVTWFYQWNAENYQEANYDYVPQRHHENGATYSGSPTYAWPGWDAIDACGSAHVLGVNEPDNTSGNEMYMTVPDLIKLHAEYLRGGKRIGTFATCNPNTSWVKAYVDSCEAHNYRVDFVATHYYIGGQKPENCINSLKSLYTATQLPVWCTEWNNGANWTSETQFYTDSLKSWYQWGSGNDQKMNGIWLRDVLKRADYSENTGWLERMAVYNNVEQKRFVHWESDDFWTTDGGEIYGSYQSDFAYNKTTDVWMNWRDQGDPCNLSVGLSLDGNSLNFLWKDPNTDWTKTVYIQQRSSGSKWTTRATLGVSDLMERTASLALADCSGDRVFRIAAVDANGNTRYSNTVTMTAGDVPNGFIKITAIPQNCEDYYYIVKSKNAAADLYWTTANATPTDNYTARVGTSKESWQGASGIYDFNGLQLVELYNSSSAGIKMQQTVRSLPNGVYQAVLYATSHNARGENGATLNGSRNDFAYVFSTASGTTQKAYFTASGVEPGFISGEPHECTLSNIRVTDGTLTLGLGLDLANLTGWHCIQIKSLIRTGNIAGVSADDDLIKAVHYAAPLEIGTDLTQLWQLETNANGGYALRSPSSHDFVLCSPTSNLFQTDGSTHMGTATSCYLPVYDASTDAWVVKNVAHSTYCGVGATPTADAEVKGDKSLANADKLQIYAIRKLDIHEAYIVNNGHHDANFTYKNADFSWGIATGNVTGGGGRVEYPACWTFQKNFSGWNDAFVGTGTLSDGQVGTFFNAWAGNLTYAELSQEITQLPNGVYRLKADLASTDSYARTTTKTAIYANAGEGNIARSYNLAGKGDNLFETYECYVLVKDHRMTIGARSDGTWFKTADFRLEYVCGEGEASGDILGYLDNGRALQHQCWLMDSGWVDLSAFPNCHNLQIDQIPLNALVKMAPGATVDAAYNTKNIIQNGKCANFVIVDEEPLTVKESFEAAKVTYQRNDETNTWQELFLPFEVKNSSYIEVGEMRYSRNGGAYCLFAGSVGANVPAVVNFKKSLLTFQQVMVEPTADYEDTEKSLYATYLTGKPVNPLRWYVGDGTTLKDLTVCVLGDVNRDGNISVVDVMAIVNIILGDDDKEPYLYDHDVADMTGDDEITVTDAMNLVNVILNRF